MPEEQNHIESQPTKFKWEGRMYWNRLRYAMIMATGAISMYNSYPANDKGSFGLSIAAGLTSAGLAFYQMRKEAQLNAIRSINTEVKIPCTTCNAPCPFKDLIRKSEEDEPLTKQELIQKAPGIESKDGFWFKHMDRFVRTLKLSKTGVGYCQVSHD
jgi:hypothetical protein